MRAKLLSDQEETYAYLTVGRAIFSNLDAPPIFTHTHRMKKILHEIIVIARTATYFAIVFLFMMVMKKLYLKDYDIEFTGISQALIGALIISKVILLLELISLGSWVQRQPPIVDVTLRTLLYTLGVLIVVMLEKAFEARHEVSGFGNAISHVIDHRDVYHVWATTLGASASIFFYNTFSVVQRLLGKNGIYKLFFTNSLNQLEKSDPLSNKPSLQTK